ncbi:MAG TPA: DUF1801 domain-containing protein [Candidatus Saccharimonadales bacterium]
MSSPVNEYLSNVASPQKEALERVRSIIKDAAPDAQEVISYGMPAFKYKGKYLIAYAPFKDHMSIFPGATPRDKLQAQLRNYTQAKGTIQFTVKHPLPESVIKEIVALRIAEITAK